jgi:succinoglycan biosynthesis transport protein ExoP
MRNHGLESHSSSSLVTEEDGKSLKDYLGILQRQALVITGVIVVGMTGVTYSAMNQELVYQGNFQLLVEPIDNDNVGKLTLTESNIPNPSGLDYESQIQVLRSPEKLQKVIQQLQQLYPDITYNS